jgi:hypothetical protein
MPGWQERYRDKCVSVESALQVLQPQHTVVIGMNGNIPASLCQALGARLSQWPDCIFLVPEPCTSSSFTNQRRQRHTPCTTCSSRWRRAQACNNDTLEFKRITTASIYH